MMTMGVEQLEGIYVSGDKCFEAQKEDLPRLHIAKNTSLSPSCCKRSEVFERFFKPNGTSSGTLMLNKNSKIFVGGLSHYVESDDLKSFFKDNFGPVMDAVVIKRHTDDQVNSRGFGFVTFMHENSATSAVKAHYVHLMGKKVEIRSALPHFEIARGTSAAEVSMTVSRSRVSFEALEGRAPRILSSIDLNSPAKRYHQCQWIERRNHMQRDYFSSSQLNEDSETLTLNCKADNFSSSTSSSCSSETVSSEYWNTCNWVPRFKEWLPKFLAEVSTRLREGEFYPLSSLKGDFRATCGLELDHKGIGYLKLNEFIKSFPELCKVKIVPVGSGQATHIVLLPVGTPVSTTGVLATHGQQMEEPHEEGSVEDGSLKDIARSRSVATTVCQGSTASNMHANCAATSIASISSEMTSIGQEPFDEHSIPGSPRESLLPSDHLLLRGNSADGVLRYHFVRKSDSPRQNINGKIVHMRALIPPNQNGGPGSPKDNADWDSYCIQLRRSTEILEHSSGTHNGILSPISKLNGKDIIFMNGSSLDSSTSRAFDDGNSETTGCTHIHHPLDSSMCQVLYRGRRRSEKLKVPCFIPEPKSTVSDLSSISLSTEENQLTSFSMVAKGNDIAIAAPYNSMSCRQDLASIQISVQPSPDNTARQISAQNVGIQEPRQEAPTSLFHHIRIPTGQVRDYLETYCVFGCGRRSFWMALPCKHNTICSSCKDACCKLKPGGSSCLECHGAVTRWVALYH